MLSYRHAFHAGNHADVLKHSVLIALLRYLGQKPKPYWVIDTHAGAGMYGLASAEAQKVREADEGVLRLRAYAEGGAGVMPPLLADYLSMVRSFNDRPDWTRYPGSPALSAKLTRPGDALRLFELHSTDHRLLSQSVGKDERVRIERVDGLAGLKALLPPAPRRALVLIDPSYEIKTDYVAVAEAVADSMRRFPGGVYAIWYPQLPLGAARHLPERLRRSVEGRFDWLDVRLTVRRPPKDGFGMFGSGLFVVNPPYTLPGLLQPALPVLEQVLGQDESASSLLEYAIK